MDHARTAEDLGMVDGLVQISNVVQAVLESVAAAHDLSLLQMRLLGVLRDRKPTMAELGRLLSLDKSSTTGLVDRATRHGLVQRVRVAEDGRSFRVELTSQGAAMAAAGTAQVTARLGELTDHLSATNRHRLALLVGGIVTRHAEAHDIDLRAGFAGPHQAQTSTALPGGNQP